MAARRNTNKGNTATAEKNEEQNVTATPEELVEEATGAAAAEPVAATDNEDKAEAEIDLTDFSNAVEAAVKDEEKRDKDTGDLAADLIEPVNTAFRALDGAKAKNKARAHLNGLMRDAMNNFDMPLARSYMVLADGLSAGPSAKAERQPADPTEAFVQKVVGLQLAVALTTENLPEGVDEDWKAKANELFTESKATAQEYLEWTRSEDDNKGDEPEISSVVKAAVKLAQGKAAKVGASRGGSGTPHEGPRRDIAKHIYAAFENEAPGTFLTIAEIRKFHSEEYGDNPPSAGAISARLFPTGGGKCTLEGVVPDTNENNKKGARKL
jgi:hypothetical protein